MNFCGKCHNFFPDDISICPVDNSRLDRLEDPYAGKLVAGCYRISNKIAGGGMSSIYLARHIYLNREVAVKILKPVRMESAELRKRIIREGRICGTIEHPNIVKVFDMFEAFDSICIVMELLQGETLKARLKSVGRFDVEFSLRIMSMVAEALSRAHSLNIVHRDIKPNNIFLTTHFGVQDFVKLLDFGIAFAMDETRLTKQGTFMGTPPYLAPEQIQTQEPTKAADIYSLGCVLYELLTGRTPFASNDLQEVFSGHLTKQHVPVSSLIPDIPGHIDLLLGKMLEKDPANRYQDAFDLLNVMKDMEMYVTGVWGASGEAGRQGKKETGFHVMPIEIEWDSYFEGMDIDADDEGERSVNYKAGLQASHELQTIERRTKEIIRQMEKIEQKRRTYQGNIGNAIAVLDTDLSKLRIETAEERAEYLNITSERQFIKDQINKLMKKISAMVAGHEDLELEERELSLLIQAGKSARRFGEVTARVSELSMVMAEHDTRVGDLTFQIEQLRGSLKEVEDECSREYEEHRRMLDEISGKGEKLRNVAALAAYVVHTTK
ncbi:MAG: protein kinase [Pseudomonadota bacterium]